jgi:hypothetical protein
MANESRLHCVDDETLGLQEGGWMGVVPLPVDGGDTPHLQYLEVLKGRLKRPEQEFFYA